MEWFMRKTSIAGNPIPNWALVLALLWQIFQFEEPIRIPESIFQ
jgi:hypothetical protein